MSSSLLTTWLSFLSAGKKIPLCVDLGSAKTRVIYSGKLVMHEPTVVGLHRQSQQIISLGNSSLLQSGKATKEVTLVRPIQFGRVAHLPETVAILKQLKQSQKIAGLKGMTIAGCYTYPSSATQVEKLLFQQVFSQVGFGSWQAVAKSQIYPLAFSSSQTTAVMDIGAQATEFCLLVQGKEPVAKTIPWGGNKITQVIQSVVKEEYQSDISLETAELLKQQALHSFFHGVHKGKTSQKTSLRAKDIIQGVPKTLVVDYQSFTQPLTEVVLELIEEVSIFLTSIPPEIANPALEQGCILTGGGALLKGLDIFLEEQLSVHTVLSSHPYEDVVRGLYIWIKKHDES